MIDFVKSQDPIVWVSVGIILVSIWIAITEKRDAWRKAKGK